MKFRALTLGIAVFVASFNGGAALAQEDEKSKIEPVSAESTTIQKTDETPANEAKAGKDKVKKAVGGGDMAMKRQLAGAESRYRVRSAKLAKLAAVAEEKGDADMAKRVAGLQQKNDSKHEQKLAMLREKYGAETVDGALKRVDKVAGNRKAAAAKVKAKAKTGKQLKNKAKAGDAGAVKKAGAKKADVKKADLKNVDAKKDGVKKAKDAAKKKGLGKGKKKKDQKDS
jgi:hypothetical protein